MSTAAQENQATAGPEPLWGRAELAKIFGVTTQGIRQWQRAGKLPPAIMVGRRSLWSPKTIRKFIAEKGAS